MVYKNDLFNFFLKIIILIQIHGKNKYVIFILYIYIIYVRPWSGEPIYRNGEYCGFITSAAYGFTLGKQVIRYYLIN